MLRKSPKTVHLDPGGIYVFESRHAPEFEMEMGLWPFEKLCFVRQGRCSLITPAGASWLGADDVLLIPAHREHRFADDPSDPATLIIVCFHRQALQAAPGQAAGYDSLADSLRTMRPFSTKDTHRRAKLRACLQHMVFEQTMARPAHEAAIWGLLLQLIALLTRAASEHPPATQNTARGHAFAQTLEFLDENFTDPIRIENLAAMAGISYRHYTALFREAKGETVNAYITRLRVDFAKKRLIETENVIFAGLDAGFSDVSNFYRVFKKSTGMAPRAYIDHHQRAVAQG